MTIGDVAQKKYTIVKKTILYVVPLSIYLGKQINSQNLYICAVKELVIYATIMPPFQEAKKLHPKIHILN